MLFRSLLTPRPTPMAPIIAVVGSTGTGKSKLAVDLATRFNGEIINGDAMQMYKGLPITTNQIPVEERQGIPHHLIGCINLDQEAWRVGLFRKRSLQIIEEIRSRGKLPILVGGTHYYTQSVLFHEQLLDEGGSEDEDSNKAYEAYSNEKWPILKESAEKMLQKLREVDPLMAERWHQNEKRRIRRSLQIFLQTGRPASEIYKEQRVQKQSSNAPDVESSLNSDNSERDDYQHNQLRFETVIFWAHTDREVLRQRLDSRVESMIDEGLLAEAQKMFNYLKEQESQGVEVDRTRGVWVSIGFKELEPYIRALSSDQTSPEELQKLKDECVESVKSATRQYARSQTKWVKGRLMNSLQAANQTSCLYVVDSSDADAWKSKTLRPAEDIVNAFLSGQPRPHPTELSTVAKKIFSAKEQKPLPDATMTFKRKTCPVCNVTVLTEEQYHTHLKSRRHKRGVKSAENRQHYEAYLKRVDENQTNDASASDT